MKTKPAVKKTAMTGQEGFAQDAAEAVEDFLLDGLGVPGEAAGGRDHVGHPRAPGPVGVDGGPRPEAAGR
jgi:hypothetical protein